MKGFSEVYKRSKNEVIAARDAKASKDHAVLVESIKKHYGINDFNKISEAERESFKNMIHEMWSRETGLTAAGVAFLNEAAEPLPKGATAEQCERYFKAKVREAAPKIIKALVDGVPCEFVTALKVTIEKKAAVAPSRKDYSAWLSDVCSKCINESIRSTFNK